MPGAFNLQDDAAILNFPTGKKLVVTNDTCVEDIHFFKNDPPGLIAKKALRSSMSDLAAKGGKPIGYILTLVLPPHIDETWLKLFAKGLAEDQKEFRIDLIGGDTSRSNHELSISISVLGEVNDGLYVSRSGALPGDRIYVTGTIGDAHYGLQLLKGVDLGLKVQDNEYLIDRYRVPQPRMALGYALGEIAHASADVSDGLIADMTHICQTSHQLALIMMDLIPISPAVRNLLNKSNNVYETIAAGGGDYEILFTAAPGDTAHIEFLSKRYNVEITHIGHIAPATAHDLQSSNYVQVINKDSKPIKLKSGGYEHSW